MVFYTSYPGSQEEAVSLSIPFEIAVLLRQANSETGVIGKQLQNEGEVNTFALILEYENGERHGHIYAVVPYEADPELLARDWLESFILSDLSESYGDTFVGAPSYRRKDLGMNFFNESF